MKFFKKLWGWLFPDEVSVEAKKKGTMGASQATGMWGEESKEVGAKATWKF